MGSRSKTKDTVEAIVPRDREGRLLPELRYVLIISRVIIIINSSLSVHTYAPRKESILDERRRSNTKRESPTRTSEMTPVTIRYQSGSPCDMDLTGGPMLH